MKKCGDNILKLYPNIYLMRYIKSFNESADPDWLVKQVIDGEWQNWVSGRKQESFKKEDALAVFQIFYNLDKIKSNQPKRSFNPFGSFDNEFPFGKGRNVSYWLNNKIDSNWRSFYGNDIKRINMYSEYFFTQYPFDGISVTYGRSSIHISKYEDEWYDILITSQDYGQVVYICDSIEGLKEFSKTIGKVKFQQDIDLNESVESSEYYVKSTESNTNLSNVVDMSDNDINKLFRMRMFNKQKILNDFVALSVMNTSSKVRVFSTDKFTIFSMKDEYYIVQIKSFSMGSIFADKYLCDQWDGLMKFLKDFNLLK